MIVASGPLLAALSSLVDTQGLPILHPIGPANNKNRAPIIYAAGSNKKYGDEDDLLSFRIRGTGKAGN